MKKWEIQVIVTMIMLLITMIIPSRYTGYNKSSGFLLIFTWYFNLNSSIAQKNMSILIRGKLDCFWILQIKLRNKIKLYWYKLINYKPRYKGWGLNLAKLFESQYKVYNSRTFFYFYNTWTHFTISIFLHFIRIIVW